MKNVCKIFVLLCAIALLYTTSMYGYIWLKMQPLQPIAPVSAVASYDIRPDVNMLHAVNSVHRAQTKEKAFNGFEIDVSKYQKKLVAAHDASTFAKAPALEEIFAAIAHPEEKTFWLDLKTPLTQEDIQYIKQIAKQYHIHPRRIFFEVKGGETADLLSANGFPILLQISSHFHEDENDPQKRILLNAELEDLLRRYHPWAIAASLGKYPYLQAYFPKYNKAIYSSTTKRPSLKKYFLTRAIHQDPTVRIWMQDQYTALPF
ncbi:MAG: hypothetical protein IKN49_05320 [Elusimicrobiaceae bacterium]|nr:hypothetical protein [Elusimicrobiaceae bacterium]